MTCDAASRGFNFLSLHRVVLGKGGRCFIMSGVIGIITVNGGTKFHETFEHSDSLKHSTLLLLLLFL